MHKSIKRKMGNGEKSCYVDDDDGSAVDLFK